MIRTELQKTKQASYALQQLTEDQIKTVLTAFAQILRDNVPVILDANQKDLAKMDKDDPLYDRLLLNDDRLQAIANDVEKVATLPTPVGDVFEKRTLPNGAELSRVRVPLGVVSAIYEARPNVTMDIFSLCFRTANACVLRGGTAAHETNMVTVSLIHQCLQNHNIDPASVYLMPPEREHMGELLQAHGLVDVCIPRGSQALIDYVRENASIPVIETGRGVVHIYVDGSADITKANAIVLNAKTRRVSVCNALDTLIVHRAMESQLPAILAGMADKGVQIFADGNTRAILASFYPEAFLSPLSEEGYDREFLSLGMNLIVVDDVDAAILHIRQYGSGHTESIVAADQNTIERFLKEVDASVVMANASTAFSDGGEFGLGAEIGISTQKLHARGPMGLEPLTSYKWVLRGDGQVR